MGLSNVLYEVYTMMKFATMVMVAIMFLSQFSEVLGNRFWFIIGWLAFAAAIDYIIWRFYAN
jgi:hypothetical protein